ncbi:RNA polymerase sigma factor [Mucilaginibacter kameinonensis]|uniref:RNA polymerase sigma factor n=1 Tax=Mucilaginibacter kameinonensis TaxID=452286 RepID=UPI000EF7B3E8|nr:RNA polymerase sigma-70 factor [Mucilaginibacter kameinonensis]
MPGLNVFSDDELVTLLRKGDREAFAEIYNRYFGLLFIFASRKLKEEDAAKDILQELFSILWEKRQTLNLSGTLPSYLYTAVRNRIIDRIGRNNIEQRYIQSLQSYIDKGYFTTDHRIREKQLSKLIEEAIDSLPAKMRQIFLLSRREHLSHKEIAEMLDISEQTVRSHVKHALRILRLRLGLFGYAVMIVKVFLK